MIKGSIRCSSCRSKFNILPTTLPRISRDTTTILRLPRCLHHIIIIILQRYGPCSLALASLIIDAHSSLSNAFALHRLTPNFLKSYPYPYFVCMVVFRNPSGTLYMVSEQLNFARMGFSTPCPTPSYPGGPMFSVGVVSLS